MKRLLLMCLLPVVLLGCKKKGGSDPDANGTADFTYTATYDSVLQAPANSGTYLNFSIHVLTGDINYNHLTCSITGLPAGVSVSPETMDVSKLLGGAFIITTGNIAIGAYPIQLVMTGKAHGTVTRNAVLNITKPVDFAARLAGTYDSAYDFCQPSTFIKYGSVVSTVADTPYLLKISNVKNLGSTFVVRAWVSNVVTVPVQTIGTQTIWGTGTYSHDARPGHESDYLMAISDTLASGGDTTTCTVHLEH